MIPVLKRGILTLVLSILAFVALTPGRAYAQTVANPTLVQFTASADHYAVLSDGRPMVDRYELAISQLNSSQPFHVLNIGKPTPNAEGSIHYDFSNTVSSWPAPGGTYVASVVAVGPGGEGASGPSNPFNFGCSYGLSSVAGSFGNAADSGSVGVSTQPGCTWSATSNASWITLGTRSGTGSGTATYSVAANTGTTSRTGTLTIAGRVYTVTQSASNSCTYSLSSSSQTFTAAGGTGSVGVTTGAGCAWTASANVVWMAVTTSGGIGNGTAVYTVSPNTGTTSRTCVLTISGRTYTVTQAGSGSTLPTALPSPWANRDIGSVGLAGSASYSSGAFTVKGAGTDVWGTADGFQYVYQPLNGDGQIVARVTGLTNTSAHAKAGVMLRETLTAGSTHVILDVNPGGGIEFMRRSSTGGSTTYLAGGTQAPPAWLKLVRSGSTITGSISSDGSSWRTIGTTTVTLASSIYVGLAVTSKSLTTHNTGTFDNVAVTGSTVGQPPAAWANRDIGSVGIAGSTSNASGVFTVKGAGADIWGTADAFQYVYQPLNGDGQIVARVTGITNTHTYAKAGVMLRESLASESKHVILDANPSGRIEFMSRASTGGSTQYLSGTTQSRPVWVRLVRSGSTITGSVSSDGTTWRTVGTTTVSMVANIYVGLAVTSHTTTAINTATFDQVTVR